MAVVKNDFPPVSLYNEIPFIHDMATSAVTHADSLQLLCGLLEKHNIPESICIKLIHIHYHLDEGEILALREVDAAPPHEKIPVLAPMKQIDAATSDIGGGSGTTRVYGCHYIVDDAGDLQAFEYTTVAGGPDLTAYPAFVREFCAAVAQRGVQRTFGLAVKAGVAKDGSWPELDYPDKRATFLVPNDVTLPTSDQLIQTTTKAQFAGPQYKHYGTTHKHTEHRHSPPPPRRPKTDSNDPAQLVAEGVSTTNGLFLTGIPLDPGTAFYNVVSAISVV